MLIDIPENDLFNIIAGLKYSHHRLRCNYCGDNMDGSESECSLAYMIRILEKYYKHWQNTKI